MAQSQAWCFTLNNYSAEDVERLRQLAGTVFTIFGREVGEAGTPHLQGFVKFNTRKRLQQVKVLLGNDTVHVEVARNVRQAIAYCRKDGDYEEFGTEPIVQGGRNDLLAFKESVKSGVRKLSDLRELHSAVVAKYPRFVVDYLDDTADKREVVPYPLRDWQSELNHYLLLEPVDREIVFVVDPTGNAGKSWFAHYYVSLHDNAQVLLPGKKADMAYMLRCDIRVLFLDAPRSKQGEFVQYDFLEELKNGYVACPKYESRFKSFKKMHVVCMMNEQPDMSKLSADRYKIIDI